MKAEKTAKPAKAVKGKKPGIKKILLILLAAVLLIGVLAVGITHMVRQSKIKTMVNRQNYVASKLIEMGDYESGRILATEAEGIRKNTVSRTLTVMAYGFSCDFVSGVAYADAYLADGADEILSSVRDLLAKKQEEIAANGAEGYGYGYGYDSYATLDDTTRDALLTLLLRLQNGIRVKKDADTMAAMVSMMSGNYTPEAVALLEKDDSPLAKKIRTVYSMEIGNFDAAYEMAEELFRLDGSFENRALLANLVASGGVSIGDEVNNEKAEAELDRLYAELNDLGTEYENASYTAEGEKQLARIYEKMEEVRDKIEEISAELLREPIRRAINFILTSTPLPQRNTHAYYLELAQLYYLAGEQAAAEDALEKILVTEDEEDESTVLTASAPVKMLVTDLVNNYRSNTGASQRQQRMTSIWNSLSGLLNMVDMTRYGQGDFYGFVQQILSRLYKGLIIRSIDATAFPTVRVTVNVATETEGALKKHDFAVTDMGAAISDIRLLNAEEIARTGADMSVMLVVDRSGSMDGKPMEDTKAAVVNFAKNLDPAISLGLVAFDSSAELVVPAGLDHTALLRGVDSIYASGGTSIASGLQVASDALAGENGRKIVILLSDGADGNTGAIDAVLTALRQHNVVVYTIGFAGADTNYLNYIADTTGGKFIQADSSALLSEVYASIGEYMINDYVIEFEATADLLTYRRNLRVQTKKNRALATSPYHVGVPYEDILEEDALTPLYDSFREIGGSYKDPGVESAS